jgi:hypothetical protein
MRGLSPAASSGPPYRRQVMQDPLRAAGEQALEAGIFLQYLRVEQVVSAGGGAQGRLLEGRLVQAGPVQKLAVLPVQPEQVLSLAGAGLRPGARQGPEPGQAWQHPLQGLGEGPWLLGLLGRHQLEQAGGAPVGLQQPGHEQGPFLLPDRPPLRPVVQGRLGELVPGQEAPPRQGPTGGELEGSAQPEVGGHLGGEHEHGLRVAELPAQHLEDFHFSARACAAAPRPGATWAGP